MGIALLEAPPLRAMWEDAWDTAPRAYAPGAPAPADYEPWLRALFPGHIGAMAPRHHDFWRHIWGVEPDASPDPFIGIWPRGGGKSTGAEVGTTALGIRGKRRYALYVRETQDMADTSVGNIGALLESDAVARHYPAHADRDVNKFGAAKAWRRNRLRTAGGFIVDAIGLDTASRGLKVEDQRPDLLIFDDIDGKHDSPATTAKKIATLTMSILPAGAWNAMVLGIQNLIIGDGVFTRMVDGRADYLARRIVSGPFPAVEGLTTEARPDPATGITRHVITGGRATWDGQSLATCQRQIDEWGIGAFRKEAQHEVTDRAEGLALRVTAAHDETLDDEAARRLVAAGRPFGGVDFGAWRFAFVLRVPDAHGRARQIAEYFSQRETLEHRARAITAIGRHYGVPDGTVFHGDAANPTDIVELNQAFQRVGSPYRVVAVAMDNKLRAASVERLNDLLGRHALTYRRDVHRYVAQILAAEFQAPATRFLTWRLGMGAAGQGVEMSEPRLRWEVGKWAFPIARPGEAQGEDPDDDTADGADGIAADRYALMTWWRAAQQPAVRRTSADQHPGFRQSGPHGAGVQRTDAQPTRAPSGPLPNAPVQHGPPRPGMVRPRTMGHMGSPFGRR